jgi:hypothetical protein
MLKKIIAYLDQRVFFDFSPSCFDNIRAKSNGSGVKEKKFRTVVPVRTQLF